MAGTMVEFRANGRMGSGYLATPPSGKGKGLLVIQEWWGLVDHIKQLADRFAAEGFVALAPDLYHGKTTGSPDDAGKMLMALNIAEAGKDIHGAATFLLARDDVTSERVGAMGFCMGGQLALYAGCEYPEQIGAVVDFYGIHPKVHPDLSRLGGPVLAHFGEQDPSVPVAQARELVKQIQAAGKTVEAHFYHAGHAFFNDARPEAYDKASATSAWERTLEFLRTSL
ncbi:MAG TPA: dienelactone hydrolase family protein [Gemmatimonadaceae bacterium]|nr:dienelactone hydrolase family protein [Gemmatimonadaceae bacterium]